MKTTFVSLCVFWFGVMDLTAQLDPIASASVDAPINGLRFEVVERDAHSRLWARVSFETNRLGKVSARTNTFTELQTGLHYREGEQWLASEAKIELLPNNAGAAAAKGPHKVFFPPETKAGIIELQTPDSQWLRSRVWGFELL